MEEVQQHRQTKRNRMIAPLGAVVLVLAVIGLISVVVTCIRITNNILDNSGEKEKFERMLMPILMLDPPAFDTIESVDPNLILQASVWSTVMGEKRNSYPRNQDGSLLVPATDMEVSCARLFGSSVTLEHRSFSDFDATCIYNSEDKTYYVPTSLQNNLFIPQVESIDKKGDELLLTVGYVSPSPLWSMDTDGNTYAPTPDKYMIYVMKKEKDNYILTAIRYPDTSVLPSSSASSANTSSSGGNG